jgi:hypothetical protein
MNRIREDLFLRLKSSFRDGHHIIRSQLRIPILLPAEYQQGPFKPRRCSCIAASVLQSLYLRPLVFLLRRASLARRQSRQIRVAHSERCASFSEVRRYGDPGGEKAVAQSWGGLLPQLHARRIRRGVGQFLRFCLLRQLIDPSATDVWWSK